MGVLSRAIRQANPESLLMACFPSDHLSHIIIIMIIIIIITIIIVVVLIISMHQTLRNADEREPISL